MQGARVAAVQQSTGLVGMEVQDKTEVEIRMILDNRGVHSYLHLETDDDIYNMTAAAMPSILETLKDMRANDDYLNYEKTITREQKKILEDTIDRYFAQLLTPNSAHALPGSTIVSYNCAGGYDGRAQPSVLCVYGMPPAMMHARVGCNSHSTALCGHAGAPWHGGACGAPVHAAAYAGYATAAAALQARQEALYRFNSDIKIDYSALLTQLETSIAQITFEDISVAAQIVANLDLIRQNFAKLLDKDKDWFQDLEQKYAEAALKHLKGLYSRFIRETVDDAKTYLYIQYKPLFNQHILILSDTELSSCVILLEKMQESLGLTLDYKLEEYNKTVDKMLKEVRAPEFTPSRKFANRIKDLNTVADSDTQFQTLMTSVNLDMRIKRIQKLLWEDLQRTYESHKTKYELHKFQKTILYMEAEMQKPGFTPSDEFGKQIESLKKRLDRERPREDNIELHDFNLRKLMHKRNLFDMLHKMYQHKCKKIAAGLESGINKPVLPGAASPLQS